MRLERSLLLCSAALAACSRPPPAPEGLDAASSYMVREFYADDATFQAGIQGFMDWFENGGGKELVGLAPGEESGKPTEAFTVGDLTAQDVAHLPLDEELVDDPKDPETTDDDVYIPRDVSTAAGVVSLAEMDCTWKQAEALLVRKDQNAVFDGDWESYVRTYVTARGSFDTATADEDFPPIRERLDPFAEGFDGSAYAGSLLFTDNIADPTPLLGVNIPGYPLDLDLRHGMFEVFPDEDPVGVLAIVTYNPAAVWGPTGGNGLFQSFSIELNVERPGNKTLRMLAVWAEPRSPIISADSNVSLNYAINKSLTSSERMSKVCSGEEEIGAEPE